MERLGIGISLWLHKLQWSRYSGVPECALRRHWFQLAVRSPTLYWIIGLLLLGAILAHWVSSNGGLADLREDLGPAAPWATVPVHVVLAITPFPSDLVAIGNGAFYGLVLGTAFSWLAWWAAALLEYGLGRRARKDFELDANLDRIPGWLQQFPVDHPVFLIGVRQVPWLGGHLGSILPGAAGVKLRRYSWCSAIAVIPGSILMTAIGAGLVTL